MKNTLLICMVLVLATGCAGLEIRQATRSDTEGLRFYRPWPYLWITVNDKGQCVPSITYLPNTSQEYLIIPRSGFGSITFKPTLQNGWNLTALDAAVDTKAADVLNAVGGLLGKLTSAGMLQSGQASRRPLGPGLYRFEFKDGFVVDMEPVVQVSDASGNPLACPALVGIPGEEAKPAPKPEPKK